MTANRIIHHIFNQPDIRHVDQSELERLVETYPYFAAARLLLAQKQYVQRPDLTAPTLKKAQLYSSNPQHLHQLLTDTTLFEEAPVAVESTLPAAVQIEQLEDAISAEDQQILDEIEAEDKANAALAAQKAEIIIEEEEVIVEEEPIIENKEEVTVEEEPAAEEENDLSAQGDFSLENNTPLSAEGLPITAEEENNLSAQGTPSLENNYSAEGLPITAEEENDLSVEGNPSLENNISAEEEPTTEEENNLSAQGTSSENNTPLSAEQDEIVALDYEAIKEEKAFEAEKASEAQDEIVALDYESIKEEKAFEAEKASDAPDEIVAIDYEAIKEEKAFEAERTSDAPDEVVAIDYEALKEEKPHYEPEIEEEDILAETETTITGGISLPAPAETTEKQQVVTDDDELEEGPIRIHPIDTPEEETVLTFQPLYTEDYFAYKKLKDPNTAEMMNDKAQAEMRSFTDWLRELKDNFVAGKATKDWYHQQMHRLYEDDEPEVSERVEKMAMESITLNDDIVSETLAEIWVRQHQHAKAIVIYQKLSLLNPDKNAYFAQKIKELQLITDNNK
ncbi:hypothetical protein GFS24_00950 [Chitinophaga sp. SYP-B3965]|uniref:hypothetical protein n=1 Tax=Chitinophaga sp. SYP-B3965 TaxID=2663120 RepID=UPI00129987F1|nr:hypothetical protein [Chitinophaga sp. SYP-B3965]MRG43658.1 hypothetical protein [Chitinophaga sp. SYP-B3965]